MRNGSSLHPGYSLGSLQSMLEPSTGLEADEGNALMNANRGMDPLSRNQDVLIKNASGTTNDSSLNPQMLMPSASNSGIIPSFAPPQQNHYGLLNHFPSGKVITVEGDVQNF